MTQGNDWLARLYDEHALALFAFLLQLSRSESDTRDLLQQVFARLAARPDCLLPAHDERAFLIRLAHNLFVDSVRRRDARERHAQALAAEQPQVFETATTSDEQAFRDALSQALAVLPVDQRAVVHLRLWEAMTFHAIARTLNIPLNTAASRYRYGLDKLRQLLRPLYEEIR